jgi:hypothetical protein
VIALGFGLIWIGYQEMVYGYCLLKGYDVTWLQLANPVKLYQWPSGSPPLIPDFQIRPTGGGAGVSSNAAGPAAAPG